MTASRALRGVYRLGFCDRPPARYDRRRIANRRVGAHLDPRSRCPEYEVAAVRFA